MYVSDNHDHLSAYFTFHIHTYIHTYIHCDYMVTQIADFPFHGSVSSLYAKKLRISSLIAFK